MAKNVTLVFPGQGSQYVGMGKNIDDSIFNQADEALGFSLSKLCQEGPVEDLKKTENTQPAIVTHSYGLWKRLEPLLESSNANITAVLGHSVGEYSALAAAGAVSFTDAVKLVRKRGQFMQEAVPAGVGKMVAVLKLNEEQIKEACDKARSQGLDVMPANFNDPTQTVISGTNEGCDKAIEVLTELTGSKVRAIPLKVSAPFHCNLMKPAADNLAKEMNSVTFNSPSIPYIANIDATLYGKDATADTIKKNLVNQVCGSVLWTDSIRKIAGDNLVIEVGPGKVLTGLIQKINPELDIITLDSEAGFESLKEKLS